jgi:hypothetical protein
MTPIWSSVTFRDFAKTKTHATSFGNGLRLPPILMLWVMRPLYAAGKANHRSAVLSRPKRSTMQRPLCRQIARERVFEGLNQDRGGRMARSWTIESANYICSARFHHL